MPSALWLHESNDRRASPGRGEHHNALRSDRHLKIDPEKYRVLHSIVDMSLFYGVCGSEILLIDGQLLVAAFVRSWGQRR
jgi:hypothetical protein